MGDIPHLSYLSSEKNSIIGMQMDGCIHLSLGSDEGNPQANVYVLSGRNPIRGASNEGFEREKSLQQRGTLSGKNPTVEDFNSHRTFEKKFVDTSALTSPSGGNPSVKHTYISPSEKNPSSGEILLPPPSGEYPICVAYEQMFYCEVILLLPPSRGVSIYGASG